MMSWQKTVSSIAFDHVKVQNSGPYGIELQVPGSGTFNTVTVIGVPSDGLENALWAG